MAAQFRWGGFLYFFILLAAATLAYLWQTGLSISALAAVVWSFGVGAVTGFGNKIPGLSEAVAAALSGHERLFEFLNPDSVLIDLRVQEIVVFVIVSGILALKGWRSNQLLINQAETAAERANLSRYFPPTLVDELAHKVKPFGDVRSQEITVPFADIVGFTRFAESREPTQVVEGLRRYHAILEDAVFSSQGTLDKLLGDSVMATFRTPTSGPRDAANALQCGCDMLRAVDAWNEERRAAGEPTIQISIRIHFGAAILGDIGSERRLEFATLGDTVNVASRL
ncbi:MAG: adenylate/guanylate cyclase domain-containing protein [Alphaproteobacteria bacterium]|nr:adenylate/guanylate cyclase domain-containing protein [Alphaproteobacteria bacterium]